MRVGPPREEEEGDIGDDGDDHKRRCEGDAEDVVDEPLLMVCGAVLDLLGEMCGQGVPRNERAGEEQRDLRASVTKSNHTTKDKTYGALSRWI
jgi:hypothetical protein